MRDSTLTPRDDRDVPSKCSEGLDTDFFERHYRGCPSLPLLPRVCRDSNGAVDCAVIGGLYRGISNDLRKCSPELQVEAASSWFCHNHPGHACRGNALNLGRKVVAELRAREAAPVGEANTNTKEPTDG